MQVLHLFIKITTVFRKLIKVRLSTNLGWHAYTPISYSQLVQWTPFNTNSWGPSKLVLIIKKII